MKIKITNSLVATVSLLLIGSSVLAEISPKKLNGLAFMDAYKQLTDSGYQVVYSNPEAVVSHAEQYWWNSEKKLCLLLHLKMEHKIEKNTRLDNGSTVSSNYNILIVSDAKSVNKEECINKIKEITRKKN